MKIFMAFKMAIQSILSSKIRSFLTMLGVIIGVAAVIILVNLVTASTTAMKNQLESMGTNLITVNIRRGGATRNVTVAELENLVSENSESIASMTPVVSGTVTAKYGSANLSTSMTGANGSYSEIRNHHAAEGRFISETDVSERKAVAVIGAYIKNEFFGGAQAVGQQIKINNQQFTVIGVLENKSSEPTESSADDIIILPYTKAARLIKNAYIRSFSIAGKSSETMDQAMEAIQTFLYKKFKSENAYNVFNQAEIISNIDDALQTMTFLMAGIAGISLLVGGIGIMNIMLVTVTERTREIGIRKAIGARTRSILTQFLIEAAVISCLGGALGIAVGVTGSYFICLAMTMTPVPLVDQIGVISGSFAFSAALGVFFGIYPAQKAAKLNPIEALRFE